MEPSSQRGQNQQFLHFAVGHHDIGRALKRFIITPLEAVAHFRRSNEPPDFSHENGDILRRDGFISIHQLIDSDDHVGERMKPGEPGIVHHQLKQLSGRIDSSVDAFKRQLLGHDQRFVKAQKPVAHVGQRLSQWIRFVEPYLS